MNELEDEVTGTCLFANFLLFPRAARIQHACAGKSVHVLSSVEGSDAFRILRRAACVCTSDRMCTCVWKMSVKSRHCIPSAWAWLRACSCVHARRCLHQACRPDSALHRRCMGTWSVQYSRWHALLCWDLRTRQKRVGTFMKQPG